LKGVAREKGTSEGTMKKGETSECPIVQTLERKYLTASTSLVS